MSRLYRIVSDSDAHHHPIRRLLLPSVSSLLLSLVIALAIVGTAFFLAQIHQNTELNRSILDESHGAASAFSSSYHDFGQRYAGNGIISYLPLFIFWGGVGVLVYSFAANIVSGLKGVAEVGAELEYVHVDKRAVILNAIERLTIRIVVAVLLIVFVQFSLETLLPAAAAVLHVMTTASSTVTIVQYGAAFVLSLLAAWHVLTVLLRLLVLRTRIFYTPDESL